MEKLDAIPEPNADGSGMGYGGTHSNRNLPIFVAVAAGLKLIADRATV